MDWRSFSRACLLLVVLAAGCGRNAVRASEKQFLADQVMVFDNDPQEASAEDHILTNRGHDVIFLRRQIIQVVLARFFFHHVMNAGPHFHVHHLGEALGLIAVQKHGGQLFGDVGGTAQTYREIHSFL